MKIEQFLLATILFLPCLSAYSQIGTIEQLEADYGLEDFKLGLPLISVSKTTKFYKRDCGLCNKVDSVEMKYKIKDGIVLNGIIMNDYCYMHFIDSVLYKIEMPFDLDMQFETPDSAIIKMVNYLNKRYGKRVNKPLREGIRIWESNSVYLEAYLNLNERGKLVVYLKHLEKKFQRKVEEIKTEELIAKGFIYKGNGTFVPSFSFCNKYFIRASSLKEIENLFPRYSKTKPDTIENKITTTYEFYANRPMPILEIETNLKNTITHVTIWGIRLDEDFNSQVLKAGYQTDYTANAFDSAVGQSAKHYKHPSGTYFSSHGDRIWWQR